MRSCNERLEDLLATLKKDGWSGEPRSLYAEKTWQMPFPGFWLVSRFHFSPADDVIVGDFVLDSFHDLNDSAFKFVECISKNTEGQGVTFQWVNQPRNTKRSRLIVTFYFNDEEFFGFPEQRLHKARFLTFADAGYKLVLRCAHGITECVQKPEQTQLDLLTSQFCLPVILSGLH